MLKPFSNLAFGKPVRASSFRNPYVPEKAVSGLISEADRWLPSAESQGPHWFEIDLIERTRVGSAILYFWQTGSPDDSVRFEIDYEDGAVWHSVPGTLYSRDYRGPVTLPFREPVYASKFRVRFRGAFLSLAELQLYRPGESPVPPRLSAEPQLEQVRKNADYDPTVKVLVSQFGYHPDHRKRVVYLYTGADLQQQFTVVNAETGEAAHTGKLDTVSDDFGTVQKGDFSALAEEGEYYVQVGTERSIGTFRIGRGLWGEYQKLIALHYFGARRIGEDSIVGDYGDTMAVRWDDARTADGRYKYIGKGFADGDDLRRFCNASLIVAQYCLLKRTNPFWDTADWIYDQVRWGLDGVLSFLGYDGLLKYGLHIRTPDIHYGTDGKFENGDEGLLIDPIRDEEENAFEYNTLNEEVIHTSLLLGPAEACMLYYDKDPEFFERVKQLVIRGYRSIERKFSPFPHKYSLSAWIWLNGLMYKLTDENGYKERAVSEAERFMQLQVEEWHGDETVAARGWYKYIADPQCDPWVGTKPRFGKYTSFDSEARSPWGEKPEQEIMIVPWIYQGLFRLTELLPDEESCVRWRKSLQKYARDYLLSISRQNAYGMTPMKVGSKGLIRQKGTLSYQYHGEIGRLFHQLANGAFLMKAGVQFGDPELIEAAWDHAYYFTGCNPLGIGAIYGLSRNIPSQQYKADTVGKAYPGGVCNGFNCVSGTNDYPQFQYWEFYGYANLASLWFATEIGSNRFDCELEMWPREIREAPHTVPPENHSLHTLPVRLKSGFAYRFAAWASDRQEVALEWQVNGLTGGNAQFGTITPNGEYRAPDVKEETIVIIGVRAADKPASKTETRATILPVPQQAVRLRCRIEKDQLVLDWDTLDHNVTGYTIWRRQPVTLDEAGTIFERVGFTGDPNETQFIIDFHVAAGTQFLVKAYHRNGDKNYGFGPDSNVVTVFDNIVSPK